MNVRSAQFVPVTELVGEGHDWLYEELCNSKDLTWGGANRTLIDILWFEDELRAACTRASRRGEGPYIGKILRRRHPHIRLLGPILKRLRSLGVDVYVDMEN